MSRRRLPWGATIVKQLEGTDPYVGGAPSHAESVSASLAMQKAGMLWTARRIPMMTAPDLADFENSFPSLRVTHGDAIVRSDTGADLGVVGGRYTQIQPEEHAAFADAVVEEDLARHVFAGETRGGSRQWVAVRLDRDIYPILGWTDEIVACWLLIVNSFDGHSGFRASMFPLREACVNGMLVVVGSAALTWTVRHTIGATERITEARRALRLARDYLDEFEEFSQDLGSEFVTDRQVGRFVNAMFPITSETKDVARGRIEKRREELRSVIDGSENLDNVRRTRWGLLNATAEWELWLRALRGDQAAMDRADWQQEFFADGRRQTYTQRAVRVLRTSLSR